MTLIVRTAGPPLTLASAVTREVHSLDPDQPVADIRTMERSGESVDGRSAV